MINVIKIITLYNDRKTNTRYISAKPLVITNASIIEMMAQMVNIFRKKFIRREK